MARGVLRTLVLKEFQEAFRSRWLMGLAGAFALVVVGISLTGSLGASIGGYSGFGRTTAVLVNLILLIVPLMGLVAGTLALSGERERGTLTLLLALPIRPSQIFMSKILGLGLALGASLSFAFGIAGLVLAVRGGLQDIALYGKCFAATLLLAGVSLSLGLWISSFTRRIAPAIGLGLLAWLSLVFVGDLGLLGTSLAVKLSPGVLLASAWLNPLSLYRILAVNAIGANLEMLGPVGACAVDSLGRGLSAALLAGLAGWILLPLVVAYITFRRNPLREG